MTEHEKLKIICDEIGYDLFRCDIDEKTGNISTSLGGYHNLDIREIIFTEDFMNNFFHKIFNILNLDNLTSRSLTRAGISQEILKNLDNPVDYIYNLIFNTTN